MSWASTIAGYAISVLIFVVFFVLALLVVVVLFLLASKWLRRRAGEEWNDAALRILPPICGGLLLALFWAWYPPAKDHAMRWARAVGLLERYELVIYTVGGQHTRDAGAVASIARSLGFEEIYIERGDANHYGHVSRTVGFNSPSLAAASRLRERHEEILEVDPVVHCEDLRTGEAEGITHAYVEFWFADPERVAPDPCDPKGSRGG